MASSIGQHSNVWGLVQPQRHYFTLAVPARSNAGRVARCLHPADQWIGLSCRRRNAMAALPATALEKHPSGTLRDLRCFFRGPRRGASSARLFRPVESGQRKPRPDELPQDSGGALPLADRRRLTRAPRPRECAVRRHEPHQHGVIADSSRKSTLSRIEELGARIS
jgi:hypothetical protein